MFGAPSSHHNPQDQAPSSSIIIVHHHHQLLVNPLLKEKNVKSWLTSLGKLLLFSRPNKGFWKDICPIGKCSLSISVNTMKGFDECPAYISLTHVMSPCHDHLDVAAWSCSWSFSCSCPYSCSCFSLIFFHGNYFTILIILLYLYNILCMALEDFGPISKTFS